jgi:hypothetical protein
MSDSTNDPVQAVRTDKFVMPVIPEELQIDPGRSPVASA